MGKDGIVTLGFDGGRGRWSISQGVLSLEITLKFYKLSGDKGGKCNFKNLEG